MVKVAQRWVRVYRFVFALLTLFAVVYQFWYLSRSPTFRPANFFSFFTIQSNMFAAAVLLWGAFRNTRTPSPRADLVRGAAVLYLSITGVVYGVLLAGIQADLQLTLPWVDLVLHRIMPLVMVFDWLVDPPSAPISLRDGLVWLIYPLLYAVYSLVRGLIVGWYPYPFLNPGMVGGYGVVALYCVGIALGTLLFTALVLFVGQRVRPVSRQT